MNIKLNKEESLEILKANREKHIEEFGLQIQGWKKAMEEYGTNLASWSNKASEDIFAKANGKERPLEPSKPQSYLDSYDRYIELITANVTEIIEVSEYEYNEIVKNQFGWTKGFLATTNMYSSN